MCGNFTPYFFRTLQRTATTPASHFDLFRLNLQHLSRRRKDFWYEI